MAVTDNHLHMAIMFDAAACYEVFDRIGDVAAAEAAQAANEHNLQFPCWMPGTNGRFREFDIPHFGRRSSVFVLAIIAGYLVWISRRGNQPIPDDNGFLTAAAAGYDTLYAPGREHALTLEL